MKDIKIGIIGGDQKSRREVMVALSKIHGGEIIASGEWEGLQQGEPLIAEQMPKFKVIKPKGDDSWRGGSRGKGGKTKWPRR